MSFIRSKFAPRALLTVDQWIAIFVAVADELDMPDKRGAVVCAAMCAFQEAGADLNDGNGRQIWIPGNMADPCYADDPDAYPHDSEGNDGRSTGPFQQQMGTDWGWGGVLGDCAGTRKRMDPWDSTRMFFGWPGSGLRDKGYNASNAMAAGDSIQRVQGSSFPRAYDQWWGLANAAYDRYLGNPIPAPPSPGGGGGGPAPALVPNPAWRGDPLFLPQLLRAFGVSVSTYTDADGIRWDQRGHGDFGKISWVLWHHTGSVNETDEGIAHHPALGLAANMLIHPDGHVVLTGSGIAWHGGVGIYPGIPEDGINQVSIGIECSYGPDRDGNYTIPWPTAQMNAMIAVGAAISWFLGDTLPVDHQISHKAWAGADNPLGINKQGKPDPGNLDMNWFRAQIAARMALGPTTGGDDWMADPTALELLRDIHRETVTQKSPSRSFMAEDGKLIDSPLGIEWNTDGNAWTLVLTEAYWNDTPLAITVVEDIAANGVRQTSWAGSADKDSEVKFNQWLRDFGQAYCQGLVRRKAQWNALVDAVAALSAAQAAGATTAVKAAPRKRAPRKKAPAKTADTSAEDA
ncbi:endolysin [Mycobacterium phage Adawi]|uniref:N-acetylmuramoyl-L-alanine amidase n=1 Tax=Mycobacterium phage Adawi TaxID=1354507 RepID=T2A7Y9_9CAUD|nr:endolysin [Mycobacterium phage Adawi]AGU91960.1 lysin A [Mycobacterium phage Adawi]